MTLAKILLCLDTDPQPSVFDAVVAVDAGVDHLLRHSAVTPEAVRDLVYGAMFTRGPADLKNTAIFIGGSDVEAGERLLQKAKDCFFGPMRVSLMLDSNGANTTAAAAVLSAKKHFSLSPSERVQGEGDLAGVTATVLAATGSVGRRVVGLLAREGANVRVCSRQVVRALEICDDVKFLPKHTKFEAWETSSEASVWSAIEGAQIVIAAGAPGVELLSESLRRKSEQLKVVIDLNAVPPVGIAGINPQDKAVDQDGQICYGAIGVGGLKMKLHKACIRQLFERNDLVLDADEILTQGKTI